MWADRRAELKGVISDEANNDGRNGVQGMGGYTGGHVERGRFGVKTAYILKFGL